jgi:hypothetical protein
MLRMRAGPGGRRTVSTKGPQLAIVGAPFNPSFYMTSNAVTGSPSSHAALLWTAPSCQARGPPGRTAPQSANAGDRTPTRPGAVASRSPDRETGTPPAHKLLTTSATRRCTRRHDVAPCTGPDLQERHLPTQTGKGPFRLIIPRSWGLEEAAAASSAEVSGRGFSPMRGRGCARPTCRVVARAGLWSRARRRSTGHRTPAHRTRSPTR